MVICQVVAGFAVLSSWTVLCLVRACPIHPRLLAVAGKLLKSPWIARLVLACVPFALSFIASFPLIKAIMNVQ